MRLRPALAVGFVVLALASAGAGAFVVDKEVQRTIPHGTSLARGVRVEGKEIPDGADPESTVEALAAAVLDRPIDVRYDDDVLFTATPRELGATIDTEWVLAHARRIGRTGDLYDRYREAKRAAAGDFDVRLPIDVPVEKLAARLAEPKDELDERPTPSRRHIGTGAIDAHKDGTYLDAFTAVEALERAMRDGGTSIELAPYKLVPRATEDVVKSVDVATVVSSFETHFGGPPGRDQNIARASGLLDGVVLLPNEEVSYNAIVGPRSIENGFASAPEIYKGEMREGVGGGACQVASTLHAAAFFGGFDILERRNHSRPSGYIRPGLDATVSYPVLDLRIKNPYDFPVVLHASDEKGTLRFEILGRERPRTVELATETGGIFNYTRKLEKSGFLPEGEYRVKQRGKNGMSIKRHKTIREKDGATRVEDSTDIYPATQEVLIIGPKFDETTLPPLPDASAPTGAPAAANG